MTDRHYPPRNAGPPGPASSYQVQRAHDPQPQPPDGNEEPPKPKIPVNVIQVSASAGAAVTSAVAASFFGVGGTLAGAAFGSVVSSVAGALYQESLKKAHEKVATATAVVVQRFPGDVPQAQSIHRMAGPAGVPAPDSLSRVGQEDTRRMDVEHIQLPIGEETQEMGWSGHADHSGGTDVTRRMPPVSGGTGNRSYPDRSYQGQSYPGQSSSGHQPYSHQSYGQQPPPPTRRSAQRAPEPPRIWWRRPGFIMAGISMAGFLIALFFIVGTESVIGHPISGGDGGTTLTKLVSNDTKSTPKDTSTDSPTPSGSPTPTDSATSSPTDSATATPTDSAAPDTTATSGPSDTSTDSATTDGSSGDVQSTDQPQSTDSNSDQSDQSNQGLNQQSGDGGDTGADSQAQTAP